MAENSNIEWTDHTFNPWIGCTKVSPACDHCYAENIMDSRLGRAKWGPGEERKLTSDSTWSLPLKYQRQAADFMAKHGRRQRVFCASLADVFDNEVPKLWRRDLFSLIEETPDLDWLLLTKRVGNVKDMLGELGYVDLGKQLPNVWLGITVCDQKEVKRDVPKLLKLNAAVRFLSIEPMLGPVNLRNIDTMEFRGAEYLDSLRGFTSGMFGERGPRLPHRVDWVIAGGESGPKARPSNPQWFRDLRDQCEAANTPFLFKQWGEWVSVSEVEGEGAHHSFEDGRTVRRIGKKAAGRTLDGATHTEFPA